MEQIIKVVVDLPLKKLNKEFDYLLPEELNSKIKIGQLVRVPFGRRKLTAFVVETDARSDVDKSKLKKVESLLYQESFFDQNLLELFYWTASYYHAYLAQVIKSALPPGITDGKIKKKQIEMLKLNPEVSDFKSELKKIERRAPKQYLILKYLLENKNQDHKLKAVLDIAETSRQTVYRLIDRGLIKLYTDNKLRKININSNLKAEAKIDISLNKEEKSILSKILEDHQNNNSFLLETNNNRRRYIFIIKLVQELIAAEKNIILLVPEIEKDHIFLEQLNDFFADKIAFLHSSLSPAERFDQWQQIKKAKVQIAAGARSAIFAPFKRVDAVIIMEENNESYKSQEHPLYHARQLAVKRLKNSDSLLVLESTIPSLESKYLAQKGKYNYLNFKAEKSQLKTEIIDMRKEIEKGNLSDISQKLKQQITKELTDNNKVILFLNRRGSANYIICRKCGYVIKCDSCDISLNYHQEQQKLLCHHCGMEKELPDKCPECGSSFISQAGIGTEKIMVELKELYSKARISRVDSDLTGSEVKKRLNLFKKGKIDILVGTSILIKNQFYDQLKCLAVISADTALNSADFRAAENNYFLLKQLKNLSVNSKESNFIIQSYEPEHYSINTVLESDNKIFYQKENTVRENRNYPPYCRLLNIIISGQDEEKTAQYSQQLSAFLDNYSDRYLEKFGEAPAVLSRLRNKYRWQLILKFSSIKNREYIIQLIEKRFMEINGDQSLEIRIDVDPYQML
ncbi:primosomal protein N' [Halanaerobium sp. ST460_2HS_T2]|uniref:replication restart helicase PriA n=1 Tax=Halanaerobium sp. ST460_2HS_T2 TaxID=2183914 RepID=UPI000DF172D6|nr:primosomal protein N' [Halanaerobium sp. ST460_2HS_T2]RCW62025.1 replication restart DNA helicase PriA [Halanaerobium sp. ST460_2HS_T2]